MRACHASARSTHVMEKHPSYTQTMKHTQLQTCTCSHVRAHTQGHTRAPKLPHSHACRDLCSLNNEVLMI
ncbi:hypothetical protein EUGRSUZ_E01744 [Eucalyptus grandis]|uniref:Uncharacterized protein n=2 Tax=Eucalyptus grandis TaxID=71139 RepID=A0ACC3KVY4_EUCGR|nr:hypothetical protein EUGRSUZ_E01744 [Eucalyptus grandis]